MSTIFNVRNLKLPNVSRVATIVGSVVVALAIIAGIIGWQLYKRLTNNTVVAYFPETPSLFAGDRVQIMGVKVGAIDKIEPAGDKMRVTFHYANRYKVPADASASILNPTLVASRTIQLSPPYTGGPVMQNNAVIPEDRTQVPVEWDELRNTIDRILTQLGPTPQQPKGPFGDLIESAADGLAGKGRQINETLTSLSDALDTLNSGRGDFFSVVRSLALFVNALYRSDQQFVALNNDLASLTDKFTQNDHEVADTLRNVNSLLLTSRRFFDQNGGVLAHDINNLAETTNAIVQPAPLNGLETGLHVFPTLSVNALNVISNVAGGIVGLPELANFANPLQFICSWIQAGSRLGYQESAELCAQYLEPVMDAIKFNYFPFSLNMSNTALTLPKQIAYSEPRLQPPVGYKDTTVPGVWSRDTLFSFGNHEPGWIVAPGMQGVDVQPFTANMLTPDSLAELMGGPDAVPPEAPPTPGGPHQAGPPNAYNEHTPLPPPWYPQPGPPPPPAPGVVPGPVAPTPPPVANPVTPTPVANPVGPPPGPAAPAAASSPGGFPAESGGGQ